MQLYSTIAILSAIVMVATTATVLNNRLPSQQAYAAACNIFDNSQTGELTPTPNKAGSIPGCSSDQSFESANSKQGHSHVYNRK